VAKDGQEVAQFRGEAEGILLREARGHDGFGYDPLFYFPELDKTFAELAPEEKAKVSHRGEAFRRFLQWCERPN
jgi:XTP/dITP diphosphohydrolase